MDRKSVMVLCALVLMVVLQRLPYQDHQWFFRRKFGYAEPLYKQANDSLVGESHLGPGGGAVQSYGQAVLASLPRKSLLLSHTDLTWNSVRYLQACQGRRPDVTHLSSQLMLYPWFARQRHLYPDVAFQPVPRDASADVSSPAFKRDLVRFILANLPRFPGGVFVDLHSVSDMDFSSANVYAQSPLQLLPHGVLYKAVATLPAGPDATVVDSDWAVTSASAHVATLKELRFAHPALYPTGTWERAVLDVFTDSLYQRGLALLSFQINVQKESPGLTTEAVPLPFAFQVPWHTLFPSNPGYFFEAARLLDAVLVVVDDLVQAGVEPTYPLPDYVKNLALALVRAFPKVMDVTRDTGVASKTDATALKVLGRMYEHRTVSCIDRYLELAPPGAPDRAVFEKLQKALKNTSKK